jgi:hypothetical protein
MLRIAHRAVHACPQRPLGDRDARLARRSLGLTQQLRSVPIVEPDAVHQIGLVLPRREPSTAIVSALVAEATALAKTLAAC